MCWRPVKSALTKLFNQLIFKRSIVWQLTALYTVSIITILLIILSVLYITLENSLYKTKRQFLVNEYRLIQKLTQTQLKTWETLEQEIVIEPMAMKADRRFYISLTHLDQSPDLVTPGFDKIIRKHSFPKPRAHAIKPYVFSKYIHNGKDILLLSGTITQPNSDTPAKIQIAVNIHSEDKILNRYWSVLVPLSAGGIIIAALFGWLLAQHSMRPLYKVMRAVETVSMKQLAYRLTPTNWPKEFTHLAEKLNAMFARLEDAFNRLTRFSADLAHELRTPINNLKGEAEIGLIKPRTVDYYQQVLGSSLEEYERLSRMIDGLLFLARAEAPRASLQPQWIDPIKQIEAIFEFYTPMAEEHHISLQYEGKTQVWADELLLQRVLHNLCSNALRYTPEGGHVTVRFEDLPDCACITVADTGIGIPASDLPYILDRFYRVDTARSKTSGGTGLGLAIVKSIMDLHQGSIKLQSEVGQGTQITLIFPKPLSK